MLYAIFQIIRSVDERSMCQLFLGSPADGQFLARFAEQFYGMRYKVFHERLGWDVQCSEGKERDQYDDSRSTYVIAHDEQDRILGTWRLRSTSVAYMLKDLFPQLLGNEPAPNCDTIWEITRFAIDSQSDRRANFGLNQIARELLTETVLFALRRGIHQYVMVVSVAVERLLRMTGIHLHRFTAPMQVGIVRSVACSVYIDDHTCGILTKNRRPLLRAA